jgi:hypothetical protein
MQKFAMIFAAEGAPPLSLIPVANGKNLNSSTFLLVIRIHPTPNKVFVGESGFWNWIQVVEMPENEKNLQLNIFLFIGLREAKGVPKKSIQHKTGNFFTFLNL